MELKTPDSNRITLLETTEYTVELEYTEEFVILHLPKVTNWTKSLYKHSKERIEELSTFFGVIGYEAIWVAAYPDDTITNKFADRLGFEFIGEYEDLNVYLRRT